LLSVLWTRARERVPLGLLLAVVMLPAPTVRAAARQVLTGDANCLTAAVYYEARGESAAGQAAVAQVVLNRARKAGFPKSVCGVIYQGGRERHGCQFSFVCSGAMAQRRDEAAWGRARMVALRALDGYVMSTVGEATAFHAARLGAGSDGRMSRVARVGAHVFLVNEAPGSARMTAAHPQKASPQASPAPDPSTGAVLAAS